MTTFPELFDQDLQISQVSVTDEITLTLHATSPTAACPDCGTISTRIQSHYRRTVHDLPNRRRSVHLVLQVRRFRCQKSTCARKIFAEQFPALARPYAQRTLQLQEALRHLGIALGGQAGTRLGSELGISGSRDTMTTQQVSGLPEKQPTRSSQQVHIQRLHREERLAKYEQVLTLLKQGMTRRAIADQVGVGLTTIENWLKTGTFPERKPRKPPSQLDPYRSYVQKRWSQGYHNLLGIYRELQTQGYRGSYENVRAQFINTSPRYRSQRDSQSPRERAFPAKRLTAFLFLRRPEDLTAEEQESVSKLRQLDPEIDQAYLFVQQFVQMMRTRTGEKLAAWLLAVGSSTLVDLHPFVNSVSEDKAAVLAGLTREESNGPTEGHITRLKLIKRSMYGRAKFDLLRIRVLSSAQKESQTQETKMQSADEHQKSSAQELRLRGENTSTSQLTTVRISEVA